MYEHKQVQSWKAGHTHLNLKKKKKEDETERDGYVDMLEDL